MKTRELKFRAWQIDWSNPETGQPQGRMLQWEDIRDEFSTILSQTSQFIVMQYTGINDINGKEIYEGDWVIVHREFDGGGNHFIPREVHWQSHRAGWNIADMSRKKNRGQLEAVGNIYQHQNLRNELYKREETVITFS